MHAFYNTKNTQADTKIHEECKPPKIQIKDVSPPQKK